MSAFQFVLYWWKGWLYVCACATFLPPGEQVSGGGVLVIFKGLEPQLEGEEPRILMKRQRQLRRVWDYFSSSSTSTSTVTCFIQSVRCDWRVCPCLTFVLDVERVAVTILHPPMVAGGVILVVKQLSESALACSVNTLSRWKAFTRLDRNSD